MHVLGLLFVLESISFCTAFITSSTKFSTFVSSPTTPLSLTKKDTQSSNWISLIEEPNNPHPPVKKQILTEGLSASTVPSPSSKVTISYVTKSASSDDIEWNEYDVIQCFLKEQQGLYEILQSPFLEQKITAKKLFEMDDEFIQTELGITNKIQAKKLAMAIRRLKSTREHDKDNDPSPIFDAKEEFSFVLGEGKVLQAMEMLVSGMTKGERAKMICRADYGYGKEGLRKRNGEEIVPPFADLCFEIELLDFE